MGRLSEEQKNFYKENGFVVLKDLISKDELASICEEYNKLFDVKLKENAQVMESSWVGSEANDRKSDSNFTVSVNLK